MLIKGASQVPWGFIGIKMGIKIENNKQLNTAQDFVEFIKEHNRRAMAVKANDAEDIFDIAVRQSSLITTMARSLAVKQTQIITLKAENERLAKEIDELQRELRVSHDLLTIAKFSGNDDGK